MLASAHEKGLKSIIPSVLTHTSHFLASHIFFYFRSPPISCFKTRNKMLTPRNEQFCLLCPDRKRGDKYQY